jgi:hypothetical protein
MNEKQTDKLNAAQGNAVGPCKQGPTEQEEHLESKVRGLESLVKRLQKLLAAEMMEKEILLSFSFDKDRKSAEEKTDLRKKIKVLEAASGQDPFDGYVENSVLRSIQ